MNLSHSKLTCALNNPAEYFISYKEGIYPKQEKSCFSVGSAVHWGLEHNTEDLKPYWDENGGLEYKTHGYGRDQILSEAMVHGFLKNKDEIYKKVLSCKDGSIAKIQDEQHELTLTAKLKSFSHPEFPHSFLGIIDLLLLTDKGFILLDYKTSSMRPDFDKYLDQIYRYIFLLKENFPDIPVLKIGIINLRKTMLRQKKDESFLTYAKRLKYEYEINDEDLINYHEFSPADLDENLVNDYIMNLSRMADTAQLIEDENAYYINYSAIDGQYKSVYWDLFHHTDMCWKLYTIKDRIWDEEDEKFLDKRDCVAIDMECLTNKKLLNKYEMFKTQALAWYSVTSNVDKEKLFEHLRKNFTTDDTLLELYWKTFEKELEEENKK